jgi:hypothetical protein
MLISIVPSGGTHGLAVVMKKPRKRTRRGVKYHALADGYKTLKSPLADSFDAAANYFNETDPPFDEGERSIEPNTNEAKAGGD